MTRAHPRSLVAGACGFLGSHMVDRLVAEGHTVVAVDNLITGAAKNLATHRGSERVHLIEHDITEPFIVAEPLDYVWNFASPASPPDYLKNPIHTMKVGALGSLTLLGIAKRHRARFFIASTSEVYGDPEVSPQPESYWGHVNPVGPRSVYDEAKRFAEALTFAYHRAHGVEVRVARIFNTYGPRMRLDDGRVVPNFIGQALRGEPLTIYGDGSQTRSFCYVDDEIDGLYRFMMSNETGPMNIGNPNEMTIAEFARVVADVAGKKLATRSEALPVDDPKQRRPDISYAKRALGWEPKVGLEDGLRRTFEYFAKKQSE
ncbi:MAG: UDP-glucuronic acid decarboxylase family protein [Thermoplasmatota archaeon]